MCTLEARSWPRSVSHLRARRWDVLLGFSPVVSQQTGTGSFLAGPDSARGDSAANFGPGIASDDHLFARQAAEGQAFSAYLCNRDGGFQPMLPGL
jgi:hypothetical protein